MLVWAIKLTVLFLNVRASHDALRLTARAAKKGGSGGVGAGGDKQRRTARARDKRLREVCTDWVIWVVFCLIEKLADRTLALVVPLYSTFKGCLLITVLCWRGAGSRIVFDKVLKPLVRPYERPLDFAGFVLNEVLDILFAALLFLPRAAARKWRSRRTEPDVPAILRGLRQPHQPKIAHSLADSLERANGEAETEKINARLSQPVTVRLQPFRPQKPAPPRDPSPGLPPPPVGSSAPFRPVPVALPTAVKARPPHSVHSAVASTSRLPIPQNARLPPPTCHPTTPSQAGTTSMYPSLSAVPPLPPIDAHLRSAPTAAALRAAAADAEPTRLVSRSLPRLNGKGKARAREDSTEDDLPKPAAKKTRRRSSRTFTAVLPDTDVEQEVMEVDENDAGPPPRSPTPPPAPKQLPPPTPAPPGAFSFASPLPSSRAPSISTESAVSEESDPDRDVEAKRAHVPKRRTRQSLAQAARAKEDEGEAEEQEVAIEAKKATPRKKVPAKKAVEEKATATPRQKALGAIAQLSKDLFDDDADAPIGLSAKKRKTGVLARSSGKGMAVETVPAMTRRTRRAASADKDDEDFALEEPPAKISPKKRKVSAVEAGDAAVSKKPTASRSRLVTSARTDSSAPASTSTSRSRSSRLATATASTSASTSSAPAPRARSRLAASTASSRPASSSAPASGDEVEGEEGSRRSKRAEPVKKKARRVLLGRGGAVDDEEVIEGAPVVARRTARR